MPNTPMNLPFSQACENNKQPIFEKLSQIFNQSEHILEIGAGTGQHGAYFAQQMLHLTWQCSDQPHYLDGLNLRIAASKLANLPLAVAADVANPNEQLLQQRFDGIYTANTLHIMNKALVARFFALAEQLIKPNGSLCIYGPFNYHGQYSSDSNRDFDQWLLARDPNSAIRDIEWVVQLATTHGFVMQQDHAMPANNRLLHFNAIASAAQ
ncbi:DUF938 domain-containing protein [Shewanella waksmanii]|uniref:DUF938 domain-containing protein n=1 Tax=Shewanella waksmanii TaxID=213783 RepID=UPI00056D2D7F|nr:DUF938 domain-containing protein [Shewanella waksmanii]